MNIVILHCHFQRGGVTQVVLNHLQSLQQQSDIAQVLLLSGERCDGLPAEFASDNHQINVPGFDYDNQTTPAGSARSRGDALAEQIRSELHSRGCTPEDTVLHWHNHSLGKNAAAPQVIRRMADHGWSFLLHIHDFAEDNRPENYRHLIAQTNASSKADLDHYLYPTAPSIQYAALSRADADVIQDVTGETSKTHWLPNSVSLPPFDMVDPAAAAKKIRDTHDLPHDSAWCLYPVRGIRRKNVGEFVLLASLGAANRYSAITLRPTTDLELKSYERWKSLAHEYSPRAIFDAAHHEGVSYAENLIAADTVLSTSVAEGFGMSFLEPWLARRRVVARELPTVTQDFEASGLDTRQFYQHLCIPGNPTWLAECCVERDEAYQHAWEKIPKEFRPTQLSRSTKASDWMDFAELAPQRQIEIIKRANSDAGFRSAIEVLNPKLMASLSINADHDELIDSNYMTVEREYSLGHTTKRLLEIYHGMLNSDLQSRSKVQSMRSLAMDRINSVRPFYPCRTEVL